MIIKEIDHKDTWYLRQEVMWPDQALDFVKLKDDDKGIHFALFICLRNYI